jgi:putative ABC transport system permease protein
MNLHSSLRISWSALNRNKLQTALTMIGMTIGVATVLTMISVGGGAEAAIEDQVRAAGSKGGRHEHDCGDRRQL